MLQREDESKTNWPSPMEPWKFNIKLLEQENKSNSSEQATQICSSFFYHTIKCRTKRKAASLAKEITAAVVTHNKGPHYFRPETIRIAPQNAKLFYGIVNFSVTTLRMVHKVQVQHVAP